MDISIRTKQFNLADQLKKLGCSVSISVNEGIRNIGGRKFYGRTYELEFYVSSKNYKFIKQFVLPYITIKYKKERLQDFISKRWPD